MRSTDQEERFRMGCMRFIVYGLFPTPTLQNSKLNLGVIYD